MFGHRFFGARYFAPRYWGPASALAAADTHDGGYSRRELDEIRRRIRRLEAAREKSAAERRAAENLLTAALERAYRMIVEGMPDMASVLIEGMPTVPGDGIAPQPDWSGIVGDGAALNEYVRRAEELAREEDDMEVLLMAAF